MIHRSVMVIGIMLGQYMLVCGQKKPQSAEEEKKPAPTEKEIKALIDQLVSPNPKPIIQKKPTIKLPKDFDLAKQELVHEARSKLLKIGTPAFPLLIENFKDEHYSLTTQNGLDGIYWNETLGDVCRTIIFDQLQPGGTWQIGDGDPRSVAKRPAYPHNFLYSQKDAQAWWKQNSKKSLYDLQLEALDWIIAEESKTPEKYLKKEKEYLQKSRKELMESGKPLSPGNYGSKEISYRDY